MKKRLVATRELRRAWRMHLAKHELSQQKAASALGYSDSAVSLRVNGARTIMPGDPVAERLCQVLGIPKSKAFRSIDQ